MKKSFDSSISSTARIDNGERRLKGKERPKMSRRIVQQTKVKNLQLIILMQKIVLMILLRLDQLHNQFQQPTLAESAHFCCGTKYLWKSL
uniref:Candidate secreted effector n=1 Tax=Meloidogyne incognita TaxID=6306 RepID=A0A914KKQ9_MELIC